VRASLRYGGRIEIAATNYLGAAYNLRRRDPLMLRAMYPREAAR
jgi:hypothetical protein